MRPFEDASVQDLAARMQGDRDRLQLVDVREPDELAIAQVDGFIHLPLSQAAEWSVRIHEILDSDCETWVMCHHGLRSAQMCAWLAQQGFTNLKNITGGIDAYAMRVDRSVPTY